MEFLCFGGVHVLDDSRWKASVSIYDDIENDEVVVRAGK